MTRKRLLTALVGILAVAFIAQRFDFGAADNRQAYARLASIKTDFDSLTRQKELLKLAKYPAAETAALQQRSIAEFDEIIARLDQQAKRFPVDRRFQFEWEMRTARERLQLLAAAVALKRIIKDPQKMSVDQNREYIHLMRGIEKIRNASYFVVRTDPGEPVHPMTKALAVVNLAMIFIIAYGSIRTRFLRTRRTALAGK